MQIRETKGKSFITLAVTRTAPTDRKGRSNHYTPDGDGSGKRLNASNSGPIGIEFLNTEVKSMY